MIKDKKESLSPWWFIPTLYFAEGVPFIIVNQMSVALLKSLEVSNAVIGLTNFLYLPWAIKFLWSPYLDSHQTKRAWILKAQSVLFILMVVSSLSLGWSNTILPFITLLLLTAFVSASQDISIDGYYLYALDSKQQAFYSGIRSAFYRVAMIFSGGFLVYLAGEIGDKYNNVRLGWMAALMLAAVLFLLFRIYHGLVLPKIEEEKGIKGKLSVAFVSIFKNYFSQKDIGFILAFILLYRFGEAMLLKMAQPFLMDKAELGGLNISLSDVGIVYGTFGILSLVVGGVIGGWLIKKFGLRKTILPLALFMNASNVLYIVMAVTQPTEGYSAVLNLGIWNFAFNFYPVVQSFVIIEQFSYGLGFTAFMVFLLYTSKGENKTTHYAISTGIMALGMIIPGSLSGVIQEFVGYANLFIICTVITIPGMLLIKYLPIDEEN